MNLSTTKTKPKLIMTLTIFSFLILTLVMLNITTTSGSAVIQKIVQIPSPKELPLAKEIEMNVSAYCAGECCCQHWADGSFADGSPVGGKAIAADTRYYPMGTEFDVPGYGRAVVKDRGGAIKGDKLDLYFDTHQEALEWGRQNITVTLYGRNE
jgi:3D (Asp-Asp-Asp) domain-containing protein